jgi:hypothetical protein
MSGGRRDAHIFENKATDDVAANCPSRPQPPPMVITNLLAHFFFETNIASSNIQVKQRPLCGALGEDVLAQLKHNTIAIKRDL